MQDGYSPGLDHTLESQSFEVGLDDDIVVQRLDVRREPVLVGVFVDSGGAHC